MTSYSNDKVSQLHLSSELLSLCIKFISGHACSVKVEYDLAIKQRGGELDFLKTFCKLIRSLQFNSRTINREIMIKSAKSNL